LLNNSKPSTSACYEALAAVTDGFIGRLASDPQIKRFFIGYDNEGVTRIRQHVVDFLCLATAARALIPDRT